MATIIIKNSTGSNSTPASLLQGELAINTVTGKMFYGSGSGNAVKTFPFPYTGSAEISGSLIVSGVFSIHGQGPSIISTPAIIVDDTNRALYNTNGDITVDWNAEQLKSAGNSTVEWGSFFLKNGSQTPLDWGNRLLQSSNADEFSIDWENRILYANDGTTAHLDWSNPSYMSLPSIGENPIVSVLGIDGNGFLYTTASNEIAKLTFPYTGSAVITGSLVVTGSTEIMGDVTPGGPYTSNTSSYNLGSPTKAWSKLYVGNNSIHIVSGSVSASISFDNGNITFNNANLTVPSGSTVPTASFATTASFASTYPYTSTSSIIGNGVSSSFNINHGFNTRNLHITVYESSSNGETVYPDIRRINANTASIIFANPPTSNQYIVYISQ